MLLSGHALAAGSYGYSDENEIIGMTRRHRVEPEETLYQIARKYNLGFNEVEDANPDLLDPMDPGIDKTVLLPTRWVLPSGREGADIVVNLAEMRIYRFYSSLDRKLVSSYPIGVGMDGFTTPLGSFNVTERFYRPTWFVPDSIRKEQPELPESVPPGPENPLGEYALKLSESSYFIHGTNKPFGIGMRVSHGCIRLYPEDIAELYSIVGKGARVEVVYEPVKAGVRDRRVYLEVHKDYLGRVDDMQALADGVLSSRGLLETADKGLVRRAVEEKLGIPVPVGSLEAGVAEHAGAMEKKSPPEPGAPGGVPN